MIKDKLTKLKNLSKLKRISFIAMGLLLMFLIINLGKEIKRENYLAEKFTYEVYIKVHNLRYSIYDWENEYIRIATHHFKYDLENLENEIMYGSFYKNKWGYGSLIHPIRSLAEEKNIYYDEDNDGEKIITKEDKEFEDVKYLVVVLENILKELEPYIIENKGSSNNKSFKRVFEIIEENSMDVSIYNINN